MIRINLLPYRTQRRQQQILQHLAIAIGAIMVAVLLVLMANWYKSSELESLQDEFSSLRAKNAELQKKIGKLKNLDKLRADVERKLALVDELQQGRFYSLNTLYEIARSIPENVWLTSIKDQGGKLELKGLGESNKAVANFMRALDESGKFTNVTLKVILRSDSGGVAVRNFILSIAHVAPKKDAKGGKKK
jgi:type IV pilus assembly protein PilN